MQGPAGIPFDFKEILYKFLLFFGILIILYALLLIMAKLNIIPAIMYGIFPYVILLIIGIFLVYYSLSKRKKY